MGKSSNEGSGMALTSEDRNWLDDRFDRVFSIIETNRERADTRMNEHSTKINAVSVVSLKAVSEHEEKHHDPVKKWTLSGIVVSVATGVWEGFKALVKMGADK